MSRIAALVVVMPLLAPAAAGAGTAPADLLPDLVQERPSDVSVSRIAGRDRLGFRSAVHNAGVGPLIVVGRRETLRQSDMTARQVIRRADGSERTLPAPIGLLRYVRSPSHSHWHYRPFERYALLDAAGRRVARDAKSGFCLGDRYRAAPVPTAGGARFVSDCGRGTPTRRSLRQGISRGWGDDYAAYLEGQSIDVTGVRAGRYRLVHTVNGTGALRESTRANNVAAVWIELTRSAGRARVRVVAGP